MKKYVTYASIIITALALTACSTAPATPALPDEAVSASVGEVWADPTGKDMIGKFSRNLNNWDEAQCDGVLALDKSDYYEEHKDCMQSAFLLSKSLAPGVLEALNQAQDWPTNCVDELESFTSKLRVLETSYDILPEEATLYEIQLGILVREADSALCL